jgi:hypothetical protein
MKYETRVNLKHLLEDIRDGYGLPIEEAIATELVANALDSRASKIEFFTEPKEAKFMVRDNGQGMKRKEMKDYHNIAMTTKIKGKGIGFAGIGAKLSLLISKSVSTETKGGYGSRCASQWYLAEDNRAPWKFIPFSGKVKSPRGTAVTIKLLNQNSPFLADDFILKTVRKHFYPLLDSQFSNFILKPIYKKGVDFFVQGRKIEGEDWEGFSFSKSFKIFLGKRVKNLAGFGYLVKSGSENSPKFYGIGISTYGKVIKWGWDWFGVLPKSPFKIYGLVEIPALAEILTTNKNDFLRDSTSLKKYYKYRKAIQEAVLPILDEMGEERFSFERDLKKLRPLERKIKESLRYLLNHFPELTPLVGFRRSRLKQGIGLENDEPLIKIIPEEIRPQEKIEKTLAEKIKEISESKKEELGNAPALSIGFEKNPSQSDLARMIKNTILVNIAHPAYQKSKEEGSEEYHLLLSVAWVLSKYLEENHSPQDFISQFLASWGYEDKRNLSLFQTNKKI